MAKKKAKRSKKSSSRKSSSAPKASRPAARPTPRTVTPYLSITNAANAIEWYKKAFGAKEEARQLGPGGSIMHAALKIGDSSVYMSDLFPGTDMQDPAVAGPSVSLHVYAKNIDKLWNGGVQNGAKVVMPLANQFWGDRYGKLTDPFGHSWSFSYPAKMTKAEKEKMTADAMAQMGGGEHPGHPQP